MQNAMNRTASMLVDYGIGRSRFQKPRSNSSPRHRQPTLPDHVNGADFTMAHEQGGVDPRAGCIADSHPPEVDSPRAQADGDRAPPAEDGRRGDGNQGLGAHDTGRAQGQVHGAQFESAHESHTRAPHQDAASCLAAKRGSRWWTSASTSHGCTRRCRWTTSAGRSWSRRRTTRRGTISATLRHGQRGSWRSSRHMHRGAGLFLQHGPGSQGDHSGPEGGGIFPAPCSSWSRVSSRGTPKRASSETESGVSAMDAELPEGGTSGTAEAGDRDRAGEAEVPSERPSAASFARGCSPRVKEGRAPTSETVEGKVFVEGNDVGLGKPKYMTTSLSIKRQSGLVSTSLRMRRQSGWAVVVDPATMRLWMDWLVTMATSVMMSLAWREHLHGRGGLWWQRQWWSGEPQGESS